MAKQPTTTKVVTKKHLARLERERIQQRYLLFGTIAVLAIVLLVIFYGIFDQSVLQKTRPVAKVGSATISTGAFQTQVRYARYQMINQLAQFSSDPMYQQFFSQYITQLQSQLSSATLIGQQVLDDMVQKEVIRQEAKKLGITVIDEELQKKLEEEFGFYENGTPTPTVTATSFSTSTLSPTQLVLVPPTATPTETPSVTATATATSTGQPTATPGGATATPEATATATAAATATPAGSPTPSDTATPLPTSTPYTREGFQKQYDDVVKRFKTDVNFSQDDLRNLVRDQLLSEKVKAEVTKDIPDVQEQVWARHILVATEDEAKKVLDRLNAGESFTALAAELSTDTSNKDQGGDLGWFTREKMVTEFSDAAFSLQIGEVSQPVKTENGYHIIQVLGHENRPLTPSQLNDAKQTAFTKWIEEKKTELNVQTFDRWMEIVPTDPAVPAELMPSGQG